MKNIVQLKEWRGKSPDELSTEVNNFKEELFRLRLRKVTDVIENPALIKELKRDIARVKTVIKEKELITQNEGKAKKNKDKS